MKLLGISICLLICARMSGTAAEAPTAPARPVPKAAEAAPPINLKAAEAEKLLKENKAVIVLDVRTPQEFAAGHIAGATNLNFFDPSFHTRLAALDKTKPYLVHCAVGGRSAKARDLMKKMNFIAIYHLEGGMDAWEKAGKPVVHAK